MPTSELFSVGDTLRCLQTVERKDRRARLREGDIVKVLQAFSFTSGGEQCQDITVQRDGYLPIAVLVAPGRFERVT